MGVQIHKHFFDDMSEVLEDIKSTGFWPRFVVSEPSPRSGTHWHDYDVHSYVMEGDTWLLAAETGQQLDVSRGDKLVIPARTLHAEGEVKARVVYLIAIPEPVPEIEFLAQHSPDDL